MSSITGFGNVSGIVNSTDKMSLRVILQPNGSKRILNIDCGYSLRRAGANTKLTQGRLIVAGLRFDSDTSFVDPQQAELTAPLGNAHIYFDMPVGVDSLNNVMISRSFSWLNGLLLPDSQDITIILTACFGDGSVAPAASDVNAFLNVSGIIGDGKDKIFKNV